MREDFCATSKGERQSAKCVLDARILKFCHILMVYGNNDKIFEIVAVQ